MSPYLSIPEIQSDAQRIREVVTQVGHPRLNRLRQIFISCWITAVGKFLAMHLRVFMPRRMCSFIAISRSQVLNGHNRSRTYLAVGLALLTRHRPVQVALVWPEVHLQVAR